MSYVVRGIDPTPFRHLYGRSDKGLASHGVRRMAVDAMPGYPDRVELRDLEIGETALLLNYQHQPADSPYRSSHAIFIGEGAVEAKMFRDLLPDVIVRRPISLRAFDARDEMVEGELCDGDRLVPLIERWLERGDIAYLHAHYVRRGCFAARIDRS